MQLREEQWLENALEFQPAEEEEDGDGFQFNDQHVGFQNFTTHHSAPHHTTPHLYLLHPATHRKSTDILQNARITPSLCLTV